MCGRPRCCTNMEVLSLIKHTLVADSGNPIIKHFQLGKHVASAGPEMVWKIYDAIRISDNKAASIFMFEKRIADKLHKPRRRETVAELLRKEIRNLCKIKHPKILNVLHGVEESHDSLAFASEPVMGSLANFLGNYDRMPNPVPPQVKENSFLEVEIKYGIRQITEALSYLHGSEQMLHGNVCPQSIIITKRGTWKLAGMGFAEKLKDGKDTIPCAPWTSKNSKMAQPDLDYIAAEMQMEKRCTLLCDMYSLGMVIIAIFNNGRSIIQANHNTAVYARRIEQMTELFGDVAHRMPLALVEPVEKMINRDVRYRPTAQLFGLLKYFDDPVVQCMQAIDMMDHMDLSQKCELFTKLAQTIPLFPRKVLYQFVFPCLRDELNSPDMLVLVLPPFMSMIDHASDEDYRNIIQPEFRKVFTMSRPVQATVYLLEKLDIILNKVTKEEIHTDVLPLIFSTLESNSIQGQEAAIKTFGVIQEYLDDQAMRKLVLPKAKGLYHKSTNVRIRMNALACVDKLLDSIDKMIILDEVLPFLTEITGACQDVDIVMSVIGIYKHMLSDRKFGLTHNLIATKVMPVLIPHTVSPGFTLEQFSTLMEVLREMLEQIDRQRRNKMRSETVGANTNSTGRKPSIDMRYNIFDAPRGDMLVAYTDATGQKNFLTVDEARAMKCRSTPSTPELQQRNCQLTDSLNMNMRPQRRHSTSVHGLGAQFDTPPGMEGRLPREPRRFSLVPAGDGTPCIRLVSDPSVSSDLDESMYPDSPRRRLSTQSLGPIVVPVSHADCSFLNSPRRRSSTQSLGTIPYGRTDSPSSLLEVPTSRRSSTQSAGPILVGHADYYMPSRRSSTQSVGPILVGQAEHYLSVAQRRRSSTQSLGPIVVPEPGRRDSKGRLLEIAPMQRRSSFQGFGESVMQLFTGK